MTAGILTLKMRRPQSRKLMTWAAVATRRDDGFAGDDPVTGDCGIDGTEPGGDSDDDRARIEAEEAARQEAARLGQKKLKD
jgi:hypothetical protein